VLDLFERPFSLSARDVPAEFQFEVLELQSVGRLKDIFYQAPNLCAFYKSFPKTYSPKLYRNACKIVSMFGTTVICERFFSMMNIIKTKQRANITDTNLKNAIRLAVCGILSPNISSITAKNKKAK